MSGRRQIALACGDYDRTRALKDGRVQPEGLDLVYLPLSPEEIFFRMIRSREFDVSELSLSTYVVSLRADPSPFVAIPVFPSRSFRHSCIFVNAARGIREPADLAGGRVGVAEYQLTANVWIRGILEEQYGLPVDAVTYVTGGLDEPGRTEKLALDLPRHIQVERAQSGQTLSAMLDAGEIDAIYSPRLPGNFGNGRIVRLFENWPAVEREYFRATGVFPIMHIVAIRREVYEAAPWIAQSLVKAFDESLDAIQPALHEAAALQYSLPWLLAHVEEMEELMGPEPWRGGVDRNRSTLEAFIRYSSAQGLAAPGLTPDSLFAPETREGFKV